MIDVIQFEDQSERNQFVSFSAERHLLGTEVVPNYPKAQQVVPKRKERPMKYNLESLNKAGKVEMGKKLLSEKIAMYTMIKDAFDSLGQIGRSPNVVI